MKANRIVFLLVFFMFLRFAYPLGEMWICTEVSQSGGQHAGEMLESNQKRVLSCLPYDPLMDGVDILVDHEFYFDYSDRLNLEIKVEPVSLSFEKLTMQAIVVCSDDRKETFSLSFNEVELGTTATDNTYWGICDPEQSVKSVSIKPEWVRDWKCGGCGTHAYNEE